MIQNSAGTIFYTNNSTYDRLRISRIRLKNIDITGSSTSGEARLVFDITRQRASSDANEMKSIEVPANINIDSSRQVASCATESGAGECLSSMSISGLPYTVPSTAKSMVFTVTGGKYNWGGSNGSDCDWPSASAVIHFGKTKNTAGKPFKTGGRIVAASESNYGRQYIAIYYNGSRIILSGAGSNQTCVAPQIFSKSGTQNAVCEEGTGYVYAPHGMHSRYSHAYISVYK